MSRIGKNPVAVPSGVTVTLDGRRRQAPRASWARSRMRLIERRRASRSRTARSSVTPRDETQAGAHDVGHDARRWSHNMVTGVSQGFTKPAGDQRRRLSRRGPGQDPEPAARLQPRRQLPDPRRTSQITCEKPTSIAITGADKQRVGQVAAEIRGYPPARALQGQGHQVLRTRTILRKEGKKK